ncbi:MAG: hypothetical protein AB7P49_18495 [Bdellovibrionales bacterium]
MVRSQLGWFLAMSMIASTSSAFGQDMSWIQPYSGNIVYGPLSPDPGRLPLCPDCDCDACNPSGVKGFFKRLFKGHCEDVRTARRECYYHNQMYHTKYTPPILPPYCEGGYGYYQTSWRQPTICPEPVEHSATYLDSPSFLEEPAKPAIPAPAPLVDPIPGVTPKPNLMEELENDREKAGKSQVPGPPEGDEKPRYEAPVPKSGSAGWKNVTPLGRQLYRGPVITPR